VCKVAARRNNRRAMTITAMHTLVDAFQEDAFQENKHKDINKRTRATNYTVTVQPSHGQETKKSLKGQQMHTVSLACPCMGTCPQACGHLPIQARKCKSCNKKSMPSSKENVRPTDHHKCCCAHAQEPRGVRYSKAGMFFLVMTSGEQRENISALAHVQEDCSLPRAAPGNIAVGTRTITS